MGLYSIIVQDHLKKGNHLISKIFQFRNNNITIENIIIIRNEEPKM